MLQGQPELTPPGVKRRTRTSAAMIGLALSMGATGLLLPRQDDKAVAAEPKVDDAIATLPASSTDLPTLAPQLSIATSSTTTSPTIRLIEHVVRNGETLRTLAIQYRVGLKEIADANNLALSADLKVGQVIEIPVQSGAFSLSQAVASPEPTVVPSPLVASADLNRLPDANVTATNDSLVSLNRTDRDSALDRLRQQRDRLRNSLAELRSEESDSSRSVESNLTALQSPQPAATEVTPQVSDEQTTVEHLSSPSAVSTPEVTAPQTTIAHANSSNPSVLSETSVVPQTSTSYRVNPGDTVAAIARAHNIPQSLLIDANRLSNPNVIFVGQVLTLPTAQPTVAVPAPPVQVASANPAATTLPIIAANNTEQGQVQTGQAIAPTEPQAATTVTLPAQPTQLAQVDSSSSVSFSAQAVEGDSLAYRPSVAGPAPTSQVDSLSVPNSNFYVENLLSEVKALRQRHQPQEAQQAPVEASQPVAAATTNSVTEARPALATGESAVNPQFANPAVAGRAAAAATVQASTQSDLVATATLGSENYAPLLQPVTGRLVSPDLPPLPGADTFLPDGAGVFRGYIWPAQGLLTSGFGWRWGRMHQGIDIAADIGTPIHAAADGVVEYAGWNSGGYGNMIEIRHADGSMTRYAHLNAIYVEAGQRVDQSEQIGEMGSTGYSTGPHLHFEVHLADQGTVNPMAYLPAN